MAFALVISSRTNKQAVVSKNEIVENGDGSKCIYVFGERHEISVNGFHDNFLFLSGFSTSHNTRRLYVAIDRMPIHERSSLTCYDMPSTPKSSKKLDAKKVLEPKKLSNFYDTPEVYEVVLEPHEEDMVTSKKLIESMKLANIVESPDVHKQREENLVILRVDGIEQICNEIPKICMLTETSYNSESMECRPITGLMSPPPLPRINITSNSPPPVIVSCMSDPINSSPCNLLSNSNAMNPSPYRLSTMDDTLNIIDFSPSLPLRIDASKSRPPRLLNSPPPLIPIGTPLVFAVQHLDSTIICPGITTTTTQFEQPIGTTIEPISAGIKKKARLCPNKPSQCKFCGEKRTNMRRHMLSMHGDQPEVREYSSLSNNDPNKRNMLSQLRRDGNFAAFKDQEIIVSRYTSDIDPNAYLACSRCKRILKKRSLHMHLKSCVGKMEDDTSRSIRISSLSISEKLHAYANSTMRNKIFPTFRNGPTKEIIRFDSLLIIYGNNLCMKYRSQQHYGMIKTRLSQLVQVLQKIRELDDTIKEFKDVMKPRHFNNIVKVLNDIGDFNEITGKYGKPTKITTIITSLKSIIMLYISECIKQSKMEDKKETKNLKELINTLMPGEVNKTAHESRLAHQRNKTVLLPSMQDIVTLTKYVDENRDKCYEQVAIEYDFEAWKNLVKYTLISVLIFNRRRPGELQRAEITDLQTAQALDKNSELLEQLTEEERQRGAQYVRFSIRGKLARGVPVLLHTTMHECIKMILKYRDTAGIDKNNPYVFALPQTRKSSVFRHVLATDLMREYSSKCGAKDPKSLRATNLRKHIATHSMTLNLGSDDIENLQNYMGHADKIHKDYYRQPILHKDIIDMSKLLVSAQGVSQNVVSNNVSHSKAAYMNDSSISGEDIPSTSQIDGPSTSGMDILVPFEMDSSLPTPMYSSPHSSNSFHGSVFDEISSPPRLSATQGFKVVTTPVQPNIDENNNSDSSEYCQPTSSSDEEDSFEITGKRRRLYVGKRGIVRRKRSWITPERHAIKRIFSSNFETLIPPSHEEVRLAATTCEELKTRTIPQIRIWIVNKINNLRSSKKKKSWSTPAKHAIKKAFVKYITSGRNYPSGNLIRQKINEYPELNGKTPRKVRSLIQHLKKKSGNV